MVNYTIGDALKTGIALLNENSIETAGLDARAVMCRVLDCDNLYLTVHRDDALNMPCAERFFKLLHRRAQNEPLAYILNCKEFMSLDFYVDENVLIPRPDTEVLAEKVISEYAEKKPVIVDMCTGSGAIAVSLAKYIHGSTVIGLDISREAVEIAKRNAEKNGVGDRCSFMTYDVLNPFECSADVLVSNPPYIPSGDILSLERNVKDYEPKIALDGGEDGLVFYRAIVKNARSCLKKGGMLAFEAGYGQADDIASLMENSFCKVGTVCDLAGIKRVVYGFYDEKG